MGITRVQARGLQRTALGMRGLGWTLTVIFGIEFMASVPKRQAFSSQFSRRIHEYLPKGPNTPLIALTGGFRTYAAINSALACGHAGLGGVDRLSTRALQVPIQMKAWRGDYVPTPPPDFTTSVWDWQLDGLGWSTGVVRPCRSV